MRLRKSLTTLGTAAVLAGTIGLLPGAMSAHAAPSAGSVAAAAVKPVAGAISVTGTLADGTAFTGQISNLSTSVVNNVLTLTGTITGTGLPAAGTTFSAPIQDLAATPSCKILTLDLGALHLDLLGLVVDLAPVHLKITAVPGAGNLLGNLLCAITGLLDGGAPLSLISQLLNQLLGGLGL